MNPAAYAQLIDAARSRTPRSYSDVAGRINLNLRSPADRNTLSGILEDISTYEHSEGRPLLSAVVLLTSGLPGEGYFKLARRLGCFGPGEQDTLFHESELERVFQHWER